MDDKSIAESTLVAKNLLGYNKVNHPGIMHVQADLLDSVGNIGPGECEILEGTRETLIGSGILDRQTSIGRNFGTHVNGIGAWLAITHAMTSKNTQCVLTLRQAQGVLSLDGHTKKVVKNTQIFHGELLFQGTDHLLKEWLRGGCQNNVVHIQEQIDCLVTTSIYEEGGVILSLREPQREQICSKAVVPHQRGLLQAVEGFVEIANMVRKSSTNKTSGLGAVNIFCQSTVEKSVLDILLVNWQSRE
jgi:hypothetical protein